MEDNLRTLIGFINNDEVKSKLLQSEDRIRRSYDTLFSGYQLKAENILNDVIKVEDYNGIIEVKNINYYTFCEHHFAPFFGTADIYYQPNKIITGLGKIVRLVKDLHSKKLQIQETMTKDIADDMMRVLDCRGVFIRTTAKHLCICSRGPSDDTTETVVTYGMGTLKNWILKQ